jgi:hypothetical protein
MHITLLNNQLLRLEGDAGILKRDFEYQDTARQFNYRTRRLEMVTYTDHLYEARDPKGVFFHVGFAPYLYYHYGNVLDDESKKLLEKYITSDIKYEFTDLRDYQIEDVKQLLSFKRGVFSVYTGYGKTQIIAQLIYYVTKVRNESLLIITPNSKSLEEIKSRVKKLYGIESDYFNYNSNYNAININGFLRSGAYDKKDPYWESVKWVIADECEYCLTDKSYEMLDLCKNLEYAYAFSGTADKSSADRIVMRNGMTDVVKRNKLLIGIFGFSLVYKKPDDFNIDIIDIRTSMFNDLSEVRMTDDAVYSEVVKQIFINDRFCRGFRRIVEKEKGGIYIPLERLEVIYYWLENVLTWSDGLIANICGEGIQLWSEGKRLELIDLDQLKELVHDHKVEVILGTRSSFRAIDLPELNKIILLASQMASSVLQQIGRVARGRKFQIFNLIPTCYVSCYTNDLRKRNKLIENYYSNCNIRRFRRNETEYGIF